MIISVRSSTVLNSPGLKNCGAYGAGGSTSGAWLIPSKVTKPFRPVAYVAGGGRHAVKKWRPAAPAASRPRKLNAPLLVTPRASLHRSCLYFLIYGFFFL